MIAFMIVFLKIIFVIILILWLAELRLWREMDKYKIVNGNVVKRDDVK